MKNTLLVLVLFGILLIAGCTATGGKTGAYGKSVKETTETGKGRAVFLITDAAANMGAVSSVKVTVNSVQVHSATKGWVTVSSTPKTYDLLALKVDDKNALLADVQLDSGTYEQVRLDVSNVVVTDANGTHEAKLPSGELKIVGNLVVDANSTSTATFDFVTGESLHTTGKGEYILAPVVRLETREDADVKVKSSDDVEVSGGMVKANTKVGMDIDGNVGVNIRVPANVNISIEGGVIKIGGKGSAKGRVVVGITDAAANMGTVSKVEVTVDSVHVHSATEGWVTVSSTPRTVDLLQLKAQGTTALLADANISEGDYQQVRLDISQVVVTDANGTHEAKLPSGELKIIGNLTVGENSTSSAVFDFMANESLHVTGKGEYILAPVVRLETREDAEVGGEDENNVEIGKGRITSSVKAGMDEKGEVKVNGGIPADVEVSIENGVIKIGGKIRARANVTVGVGYD